MPGEGVLQGRYQVNVYSTSGTLAAVITNWQALSYTQQVNGTGTFTLTVAEPSQVGVPKDNLPALFVEDAIVQVTRMVPGLLGWYVDFTGFVTGAGFDTDAAGNLTATARGVGTLDLVGRRVIAYATGTKYTEKQTTASLAIQQYVEENCAASATTANTRYASGVTPGLTVAVPASFGATWQGARHMQNVLAVIQDISVQTAGSAEFYMASTVGGGSAAFVFNTVARIGTDRSATVIFSKPLGNVLVPKSSQDWTQARNRVFVLGPGEKTDRIVLSVNDATRQANSPWALKEKTREATQEQTGQSLSNVGAAELEVSRPARGYAFTPNETVATRYAVNYFLGDTVTAIDDAGNTFTLRIISVTITQNGSDGAEAIDLGVTVLR